MSDIFDRLYKLFQMLGADLNDNTNDKGELCAYSSGIEFVLDYFEKLVHEIDVNTATELGLALYCELAGVEGETDVDEKRQSISKRFSQEYGDYKLYDIVNAVKAVSSNLTISKGDFSITFSSGNFGEDFDLKRLADVVNEFIPPCVVGGFLGDGADFDKWDATDYLFEDYDNLKLPFKMLDELS